MEERSSPVNHLVDKNGNIITITGHSNRDKRDADKYVNVIEMDHKGQASKEDTNDTRMERSKKGDEHITQKTHAKKILTGDARVINVKEHVNKHDPLQSADVSIGDKKTERKGELFENKSDDNGHDKHHQKLDNRSDTDSGVDDEELLDVVLTEEQQGMIVNALFDEDMNLRSEFDRDERGRIVVSSIVTKVMNIEQS